MSDSPMKKFLCEYGSLSYLNFNSQCWALDFVCVELDLVEKATRDDMKCFPSLNTKSDLWKFKTVSLLGFQLIKDFTF